MKQLIFTVLLALTCKSSFSQVIFPTLKFGLAPTVVEARTGIGLFANANIIYKKKLLFRTELETALLSSDFLFDTRSSGNFMFGARAYSGNTTVDFLVGVGKSDYNGNKTFYSVPLALESNIGKPENFIKPVIGFYASVSKVYPEFGMRLGLQFGRPRKKE